MDLKVSSASTLDVHASTTPWHYIGGQAEAYESINSVTVH